MDPEYEARMELAVKDLTDGTYKTIHAAAKAHEVARQTLSNRVRGLHKTHHQAPPKSFLNEAQERVIHEWLVGTVFHLDKLESPPCADLAEPSCAVVVEQFHIS